MRLVFDIEANGFYEEADTIWCIVCKDIDTKHVTLCDINGRDNLSLEFGLSMLEGADELIGHNIIDYDLRLIKKLYPAFRPKGLVMDTMLLSQLLQPDRVGGHSLGSFGEEFGIQKVENEDWGKFTKHMLERCVTDVEINEKVYHQLIDESYEAVRGLEYHRIFL